MKKLTNHLEYGIIPAYTAAQIRFTTRGTGGTVMRILITGAASGIGRAAARKFIAEGHEVFGIDLCKCGEGVCTRSFVGDTTKAEDMARVADELSRLDIKLDIILAAAGIHRMVSLVEDDFAEMHKLMEVNLVGTMLTVRSFHPLLASGGRIIIVTSEVGALDPLPFNGLYSVSKCALEAYAQALRQELNLIGESVITIRPGAIETPLAGVSISATEALAERTELYRKQASRFSGIAKRFMGKPIAPERLAKVIYRAATARHPRLSYAKNRSAGLVLLGILPKRAQCFIIRMLLGRGR